MQQPRKKSQYFEVSAPPPQPHIEMLPTCLKAEEVTQKTESGTNQHVCPLFFRVTKTRNTLVKG